MRIELPLNGRLRIPHVGIARELGVTALADSEHWNVPDSLYDTKIAFCHTESLTHSAGRV